LFFVTEKVTGFISKRILSGTAEPNQSPGLLCTTNHSSKQNTEHPNLLIIKKS